MVPVSLETVQLTSYVVWSRKCVAVSVLAKWSWILCVSAGGFLSSNWGASGESTNPVSLLTWLFWWCWSNLVSINQKLMEDFQTTFLTACLRCDRSCGTNSPAHLSPLMIPPHHHPVLLLRRPAITENTRSSSSNRVANTHCITVWCDCGIWDCMWMMA